MKRLFSFLSVVAAVAAIVSCSSSKEPERPEPPQIFSVADFAASMADLIDVWISSYSEEMGGHYIPADAKINIDGKLCGKSEAYNYALNVFQQLVDGTITMGSPLPSCFCKYVWSTDSYNENPGNGGEFQPFSADLNLLMNYASRQLSYAESNSVWANFCTYNGGADASKGNPEISAVYGCCCLERNLIMMARFYRYLLDNDIQSDIKDACASMSISSDLHGSGRIRSDVSEISFDKTAGTKTVKVTSDGPWTAVSSVGWMSVSPTSAPEGDTNLAVSVQKNSSTDRYATLVLTCGKKTVDLNVTQEGEEASGNPYTQKGMHTTQGPGYLGQRNGYNCGPHCLMQSIYKITGLDLSELTIAGWCGTGTAGTGHDGLNDGIATFNKKYKSEIGYSLSIKWVSWSSLGSTLAERKKKCGEYMAKSDAAVFIHMNYRNEWGHYEAPYYIDVNSSSLKVLNSLGNKASEGGYLGYIETRSWTDQISYINGCVSSNQVCIISKQ